MSENNEHEIRTEREVTLAQANAKLAEDVANLTDEVKRLSEVNVKHWENQIAIERNIEKAYDLVCEEINEERLDYDSNLAEGLKEIFGWEYEREVEVTLTIKISGTITVPAGKSLEDLEDEFDATATLGYRKEREGYSWSSSSVDEIEIEEN